MQTPIGRTGLLQLRGSTGLLELTGRTILEFAGLLELTWRTVSLDFTGHQQHQHHQQNAQAYYN